MSPGVRVLSSLPASRRMLGVVLAAAVTLGAGGATASAAVPVDTSQSKPGWYKRKSVCKRVTLGGSTDPGRPGATENGFTAYWLDIVVAKGVGCRTARKLAREAWIEGTSGGLRWRKARVWKPRGSGSAWVGNFVGTKGARRIEYNAVH